MKSIKEIKKYMYIIKLNLIEIVCTQKNFQFFFY